VNDLKTLRLVQNNVGDHLLDRQSSTRVRVLFEEMSQGHEQLRGVFDVAFIECLANVINDHCSDGFAAVRLVQQVAGQRGCGDFRNARARRSRRLRFRRDRTC